MTYKDFKLTSLDRVGVGVWTAPGGTLKGVTLWSLLKAQSSYASACTIPIVELLFNALVERLRDSQVNICPGRHLF